jgi:hypothetical protein
VHQPPHLLGPEGEPAQGRPPPARGGGFLCTAAAPGPPPPPPPVELLLAVPSSSVVQDALLGLNMRQGGEPGSGALRREHIRRVPSHFKWSLTPILPSSVPQEGRYGLTLRASDRGGLTTQVGVLWIAPAAIRGSLPCSLAAAVQLGGLTMKAALSLLLPSQLPGLLPFQSTHPLQLSLPPSIVLASDFTSPCALQTDELSVFVDFTPPRVSTAGLPPLGQAQPSRVSFNLAEASQLPTGSYSGIATYQTLVEVRWNGGWDGAVCRAWSASEMARLCSP